MIVYYLHKCLLIFATIFTSTTALHLRRSYRLERPNIIFLTVGDLSQEDLKVYGNSSQEWTPLDELMMDGTRFTNAYSTKTCPYNSERLLTDTISNSNGALQNEATIVEMLRNSGYFTGFTGMWDSYSDNPYFSPKRGLNYIGLNLPTTCECPSTFKCSAFRDDIEQSVPSEILTEELINDWRVFLDQWEKDYREERPFFVHLSLPSVNSSLYGNMMFKGSSKRGQRGDHINEMGWMIGEIVDDIRRSDIEQKTLVVFMSNHFQSLCNNDESNELKDKNPDCTKQNVRIPFSMKMPGAVKTNHLSDKLIWASDIHHIFKLLADLN